MPKYKVKMNYVEAKVAEFVVQAKDPDELHDLLGELDIDFLEKHAGFVTCDYEPPEIEEYSKVSNRSDVNTTIQKAMNEIKKAWEAL